MPPTPFPHDAANALRSAVATGASIQFEMDPFTALYTAGALQLALRHPGLDNDDAQQRLRSVVDHIAGQLGRLGGPGLDQLIAKGYNSGYDHHRVSGRRAEGAWAIYTPRPGTDDKPFACAGRPQDFGHRRWHYKKLSLIFGFGESELTCVCRAYIDAPLANAAEWFEQFAGLITRIPLLEPGHRLPPMAPTDCLQEDDIWPSNRPNRPPPCPDEDDDMSGLWEEHIP